MHILEPNLCHDTSMNIVERLFMAKSNRLMNNCAVAKCESKNIEFDSVGTNNSNIRIVGHK